MKKSRLFPGILLSLVWAKVPMIFIMLALVLMALMFGFTIELPILTLIVATAVTGVTYFESFRNLGDNTSQLHNKPASPLRFVLTALPAHLIFMIYHLLSVSLNLSISGSGILALAKLLSGVGAAGGAFSVAIENDEMMATFAAMWYVSYLVHVVFYIAVSYFGYRYGFVKRERERAALLAGDSEFMKKEAEAHATPLAKKVMFIPFVNLFPIYPWCVSYILRPERKLRRLFVRLIPILLLLPVSRGLRVLFFMLTELSWLNMLFAFVLFYLFGIAVSFIVWRDEEKLKKLKL